MTIPQENLVNIAPQPLRDRILHLASVDLRFWNSWDEFDPDDASLPYGCLTTCKAIDPSQTQFFVPQLCEGSDYSGGSISVSNHRVFLEKFGDLPGVCSVWGGHGTYGVAIRVDSVTEEMAEVLAALDDYPLIDEEDHSEVEMDAEDAGWESWARSEFKSELGCHLSTRESDVEIEGSSDALRSLFDELMNQTNSEWVHESGNSVHVDLDRVVQPVTLEWLRDRPGTTIEFDEDSVTVTIKLPKQILRVGEYTSLTLDEDGDLLIQGNRGNPKPLVGWV